jgi:aryl-alcohol dehydrogenase-like predicted oxidoreductase
MYVIYEDLESGLNWIDTALAYGVPINKRVRGESMQECVAVTLKQRTVLTGQVGESLGASGEMRLPTLWCNLAMDRAQASIAIGEDGHRSIFVYSPSAECQTSRSRGL